MKNMLKSFITLVILITVILSVSVYSASYLSVNPIEETKSAGINQTVSGVISLINTNPDTTLGITLPGTIALIGNRVNLSLNVNYNTTTPVNVMMNDNTKISYNFTLPQDAFSDTYKGILNFTAGGENYSTYTLNLDVLPSPLLAITNVTGEIGINSTKTFNFFVSNIGNTDITANLASTDIISQSNTSDIITKDNIMNDLVITLGYKKTVNIPLTIKVPANTNKGIYTGLIEAVYDSKKATSQISLNVTVLSYSLDIPTTLAIGNAERNSTIISIFDIRNNGNADITGMRFIPSASSIYNLSFNTTSFDLPVGAVNTVKLTAHIPKNEPSTNHSIGTVSIFSNEKEFTNAINIYADVLSRLEIEDFDFFINDDIDRKDVTDTHVNDGATISKKARPGSKIKLDFKIKNRFPDDSNIDIRDILITVNINGIEDGDDVEIESNKFDLDPDESSTRKVLEYTIPFKVEIDTYTIEITVEGEDRNGVTHSVSKKVYLRVDKMSHEIVINSATILPIDLQCGGKVTVYYDIRNIGDQEEDDVRVDIVNEVIGLMHSDTNIQLVDGIDEESTYQKSVILDTRKDISSGTYPVYVNAYFSGDILNSRKELSLNIKGCETENTTTPEQPPPDEQIPPSLPPPKNGSSQDDTGKIPISENSEEEPIVTVEKPLIMGTLYFGIILTANVVALIGIIALISKYLIKK